MYCAQFPLTNRPDSSLRSSFGSVFDCVSMACHMDGPFRPYVQRYVTILVKISEQKTEHFASRDLCAQQGGCGEKPCSPRCPRTPSRLGTGIGVPISPKYCCFRRKISEQQKKHIREIIGICKFRRSSIPGRAGERGVVACAVAGAVWDAVATLQRVSPRKFSFGPQEKDPQRRYKHVDTHFLCFSAKLDLRFCPRINFFY